MTTEKSRKAKAHIVVGIDGSASSKAALRWAVKLATALDSKIEAIIAWDSPTIVWEVLSTPLGSPELELEDKIPIHLRPDLDAMKELEHTVDEVFGKNRPIELITRAIQGHPVEVLLEASRGAEMLIVGSRGHGGFAGLLLGSVCSACAEHSACPVLVVHGE
jgi:nucleotide-binding universal stress UspA family protein